SIRSPTACPPSTDYPSDDPSFVAHVRRLRPCATHISGRQRTPYGRIAMGIAQVFYARRRSGLGQAIVARLPHANMILFALFEETSRTKPRPPPPRGIAISKNVGSCRRASEPKALVLRE